MRRKALFLVLSLALLGGSATLAVSNDKQKEKCCEKKGIKALFHSKKKCKENKGAKERCGSEKPAKKKACCAHKKVQ